MSQITWTDQARVDAVMRATGASAEEARAYLEAEEGDVEKAIISLIGDITVTDLDVEYIDMPEAA